MEQQLVEEGQDSVVCPVCDSTSLTCIDGETDAFGTYYTFQCDVCDKELYLHLKLYKITWEN